MTIRKIIGGSLVVAGLVGLLGCTPEQDNGEEATQTSKSATVEELAENEYRVFVGDPAPTFLPITGIYSFPEGQTGVSAEVSVNASDKGKNAGIAKLVLYEDGREISSTEDKYLLVPITHNKPGSHTYEAEVIDNGGNRVRSQKISIDFSGEPIDTPPKFSPISGLYVYSNGSLDLNVSDIGDNKGLKEVLLYEDGNVVRRFDPDGERFSTSIELMSLNQSGKHTYHAEAVDLGGNRSTSKTLTVNYER